MEEQRPRKAPLSLREHGDEGQVLTYASGLRRSGNSMEFRGQYT
jgi:hypothetical protein